MPMNLEDWNTANAEKNAGPEQFHDYDPQGRFQRHYARLHPDQRDALTRQVTEGGSSASSTSMELQEIRTANQARRGSRRLDSVSLSRTETERINHLERHPTALDRIETHRSQHAGTIGAAISARESKRDLPNFGAGKPYPPPLPEREEYVVEFDGHEDPLHPQNWATSKKVFIGSILAFDSLAATMGSSIFSDATGVVAGIYGVSSEVGTLATSLFVLGYAFGPILWAPISELYGRRLPILIAAFGFSIFTIAVATAENLQTIMLCRFFSGIFGSCPLTCVAAVFADIFSNSTRGTAVAVFSATVFMGPLLAPFISGFIVESYLGWRWTMYISAIMGFTALILCIFFLEESYAPVVLVDKARELRRRTKNWGIHAKQEEVEVNIRELLTKNVTRPMRILFTEPIVLLVSIYMAFLYGLLYLFLTAYALVFQEVYGFSPGIGGLPYFGMVAGETIGFIVVLALQPGYSRKLSANENVPVPEWRLPPVVIGAIAFPIGLFWFGWTGYQGSIPWIVPTLSGLCTGFGIFVIFLQLLNYIIDAYLMFAASALAANTFLRSLCGCIFPLFATYMFNGMGINYALTLLGAVAAVAVPMPVVFWLFGKKIRARSKFAPSYDLKLEEKRRMESDEESGVEGDESSAGDNVAQGAGVGQGEKSVSAKKEVSGGSSSENEKGNLYKKKTGDGVGRGEEEEEEREEIEEPVEEVESHPR